MADMFSNITVYRRKVYKITKDRMKVYGAKYFGKDYKQVMATYNLTIDHIYSISDGFKNKIHPSVLASMPNLRLVPQHSNQSKGATSAITKEELLQNVETFVSSIPDNLPGIREYKSKIIRQTNRNLSSYCKIYFGESMDVFLKRRGLEVAYLYSMYDGFKNEINPDIIANLHNIKFVPKGTKVLRDPNITIDVLMEGWKKWVHETDVIDAKQDRIKTKLAFKMTLDSISLHYRKGE